MAKHLFCQKDMWQMKALAKGLHLRPPPSEVLVPAGESEREREREREKEREGRERDRDRESDAVVMVSPAPSDTRASRLVHHAAGRISATEIGSLDLKSRG